MMPIKLLTMAAVLTGGLSLATVATAAPLGPTPLSVGTPIETVAFGCGPGFHPNPWGICRPNWGWGRPRFYGYGYYRPRPYAYYYGPRRFW